MNDGGDAGDRDDDDILERERHSKSTACALEGYVVVFAFVDQEIRSKNMTNWTHTCGKTCLLFIEKYFPVSQTRDFAMRRCDINSLQIDKDISFPSVKYKRYHNLGILSRDNAYHIFRIQESVRCICMFGV